MTLFRAFSHPFITFLKAVEILPQGRVSTGISLSTRKWPQRGYSSAQGHTGEWTVKLGLMTAAFDLLLRVTMWREQEDSEVGMILTRLRNRWWPQNVSVVSMWESGLTGGGRGRWDTDLAGLSRL